MLTGKHLLAARVWVTTVQQRNQAQSRALLRLP